VSKVLAHTSADLEDWMSTRESSQCLELEPSQGLELELGPTQGLELELSQ